MNLIRFLEDRGHGPLAEMLAAVTVRVDLAKYKDLLAQQIADLQSSSEDSYFENLEKIKGVKPDDIAGPLKKVGQEKVAKQFIDAWQSGDSDEFDKLYAQFLRDNLHVDDAETRDTLYNVSQKLRVIQDHLYSLTRGGGNYYTAEQADEDEARLIKETAKNMGKVLQEIKAAIKRIDWWNGSRITIKPRFSSSEFGGYDFTSPASSASIYVGEEADFTYFGPKELDDVLEVGDPDFFRDKGIEQDYFNLVKEMRAPGSTSKPGKLLKLYTARPTKDRKQLEKAAAQKKLPNNIFLTDSLREAEGYAQEYPPRDVWMVKIFERYVTTTQERGGMAAGNYQTMGPGGQAPIKDMQLLQPGE